MIELRGLSRRDAERVRQWHRALTAAPGVVPDGLVPVQARLVRMVARGSLPDAGDVFVKAMAFPRAGDRLRYLVRPLPLRHEAAMLDRVAEAGIAAPRVLAVWGARAALLPSRCGLATAALEVDPASPVRLAACAQLAVRLLQAGVYHPDLHAGNFVPVCGGGVAVLDLQSARARRDTPARRRALATRLLASDWPLPERAGAVVDAGLVAESDLPGVAAAAVRFRSGAVRRRVLRCLRTSTEFVRTRRWGGTEFRRRDAVGGGIWHSGGAELIRIWIGQRVDEVMHDARPVLGALFRKWWWLPGKHSVYIPGPDGVATLDQRSRHWLAVHDRYEGAVKSADRSGAGTDPAQGAFRLDTSLPWSGPRED